jgi:predicted metal-binding protein
MKLDKKYIIDKGLKMVNFPECYLGTYIVDPKIIKFTPLARLKCQNCGLYNRVPKCAPNNQSLNDTAKFIHNLEYAVFIVYQSDGSKSWKNEPLNREPIKGMKLKGTAAGMAIRLNKVIDLLVKYYIRELNLKRNKEIIGMISGHCDICGKCQLKDKYETPGVTKQCNKGYASLEALGIDCFDLYRKLKVKHEEIPWNFVTLIGGVIL